MCRVVRRGVRGIGEGCVLLPRKKQKGGGSGIVRRYGITQGEAEIIRGKEKGKGRNVRSSESGESDA